MLKTTTYVLSDNDIREAIVEWMARQSAGEGPVVLSDRIRIDAKTNGWSGDYEIAGAEIRVIVEVSE